MLENVAKSVTVVASLLAVVPIIAGLTRITRLRKREQMIRDAVSITTDGRQRAILMSIHQETLSGIVASTLTPWWQVWWPVGAWLAVLAGMVQSGWAVGHWLVSHPDPQWAGVVNEVFRGPQNVGITVLAGPVLTCIFYVSFGDAVVHRAAVARDFICSGGSVRKRVPMLRRSGEDTSGALSGRVLVNGLAFGVATLVAGHSIGGTWGLGRVSSAGHEQRLQGWSGGLIVGMGLSISVLLITLSNMALRVADYATPDEHPAGPHGPLGEGGDDGPASAAPDQALPFGRRPWWWSRR